MTFKNALAAAIVVALGAPAFAADLPIRSAPPSMLSPVSAYNWTGFYVGANAGYGWGNQNPLGLIAPQFGQNNSFSVNGGMFGGTVGGQVQVGAGSFSRSPAQPRNSAVPVDRLERLSLGIG